MSEKLAIVMPVYNEEEAIGAVLEKWVKALDALNIDYTINPYNDGSKDNSLSVIQQKAKEFPGKVIAHDKPNSGHGPTILLGYREAVANGYDWVFQIDSDDEMGPEGFAELWNKRNDFDFLVGIRDGRKQALPRKVISAVSRLCVKLFYGKSIWDVNTPYRLMRASVFYDIYSQIPEDTFAPNVIISGMAADQKLRCFESRVPQRDRQTGEVSIKKWKLLKAAMKSFMQTILFSVTNLSRVPNILFGIFLFVFSALRSPYFSPVHSIDSQVYVLAAKKASEGDALYVDFFDHKGPFFHLLNKLGYLISESYWGIWLIESIILSVSLIFAYYALRKYLTPLFSFFSCFAAANILRFCCNYPETISFELTILAISLFLLFRFNKKALIFMGITGACVLFTKQVCIGFFAAFGLLLLWNAVRERKWSELFCYIIGGLFASALIVLPMVFSGSFSAFWDCCFIFNLQYAKQIPTPFASSIIKIVSQNFLLILASLIGCFLFLIQKKSDKKLFFVWAFWCLWELFFLAKTGRLYDYQYAGFYLTLFLPLVYILYRSRFTQSVCFSLFVILGILSFWNYNKTITECVGKLQNCRIIEDPDEKIVLEKISGIPRDVPLLVWGNHCNFYIKTNRKNPVSPYYYNGIFFIKEFSDDQIAELKEKIDKSEPFIVIDSTDWNENLRLFSTGKSSRKFAARDILKNYVSQNLREVPLEGTSYKLYIPANSK